jgi:hypothetical protein
LILVQASIKGSPLTGERYLGTRLAKIIFGPGVESISPGNAEKNIDDALEEMEARLKDTFGPDWEDKRAEISSRIFYVRSKEDFSNLGGTSQLLLTIFFWPMEDSDGLLRESDQFHEKIGVDLGLVQADHIGLTISGLRQVRISCLTDTDRCAFSRAVFQRSLERLKVIRTLANQGG